MMKNFKISDTKSAQQNLLKLEAPPPLLLQNSIKDTENLSLIY